MRILFCLLLGISARAGAEACYVCLHPETNCASRSAGSCSTQEPSDCTLIDGACVNQFEEQCKASCAAVGAIDTARCQIAASSPRASEEENRAQLSALFGKLPKDCKHATLMDNRHGLDSCLGSASRLKDHFAACTAFQNTCPVKMSIEWTSCRDGQCKERFVNVLRDLSEEAKKNCPPESKIYVNLNQCTASTCVADLRSQDRRSALSLAFTDQGCTGVAVGPCNEPVWNRKTEKWDYIGTSCTETDDARPASWNGTWGLLWCTDMNSGKIKCGKCMKIKDADGRSRWQIYAFESDKDCTEGGLRRPQPIIFGK